MTVPEFRKIEDLAEYITVGFVGSMSSLFTENGVPLLRGQNIKPYILDRSNLKYISEATHRKWKKSALQARDVVIVRVGYPGTACVIPPGLGDLNAASLVIVRPNPVLLDSDYLAYVLNSPWGRAVIGGRLVGAAQQVFNTNTAAQMQIPAPGIHEQHRIASILSAYDDLIENNTRRISILEEIARRIYEEWFVRFRFPGHENVRMVESELGLVPESWAPTTLGQVAENHDRFRKPLSKMQREDFKGPYPYYGAAKVFDFVREYLFDGQFLLLAEDGSVETTDGYPVLQLTDGKFWANNHTHILRGTKRASTEFLYLRLERQPIRGYITGAAQPKLTQANINRIPVLLPPADLMQQFTALIGPLFELRATFVRQNSNRRTTRDFLLPKLISGELDVSDLPEPEAVAA